MKQPDELPPLDKLGEDIRRFREKKAAQQTVARAPASGAMRLGLEFASGVLVGTAVGYFLDDWLGTSPFLLVICLFLGSAGGLLTVYRTATAVREGKEEV